MGRHDTRFRYARNASSQSQPCVTDILIAALDLNRCC